MPIELTCQCGRELYLRDELAGLHIRCPACTATLRVPLGAREIVKPAAPPPAKKVVESRAIQPVQSEEIVETIGVGPPPLPKPKPGPPPLPQAKVKDQPPASELPQAAPPALAQPTDGPDEQIPEFESLEVMDDPGEIQGAQAKIVNEEGLDQNPRQEGEPLEAVDRRRYHADGWDTHQFQDNPSTPAAGAPEGQPLAELDLDRCELREEELASMDQAKETLTGEKTEQGDEEDGPASYQVLEPEVRGVTYNSRGAIAEIHLDAADITCLAYGANHGTHLAACGDELFCLDFKTEDATPLPQMHGAPIHCLCMSTDCRLALSGDKEGGLLLWDLTDSKPCAGSTVIATKCRPRPFRPTEISPLPVVWAAPFASGMSSAAR
jgi:hypothetical protein